MFLQAIELLVGEVVDVLGECFGFVGKAVGEFYLLGARELNIE